MMESDTNYYEASDLFHGSIMHAMGTRLDVLIVGLPQFEAVACWEEMEAEIERLSKLYNKFDEASELYTVNEHASKMPIPVEGELWKILTDCKQYHAMTCGYFDISLKDYNKVVLDASKRTVFFQDPSIQLDLGAFGKGYALESLRPILEKHTVNCALLNFGNSSVMAIGSHPHGDSWSIGVEKPTSPQEVLGVVELRDCSMSTSGNMPTHSSHIVDPHTGVYSSENKLVSIKTFSAVDAEVLSTSLVIAPDDMASEITANFIVDEYYSFSY